MIYPKTEFMVSASPLPITARPGVRFPPCNQVTTGKQLSLDEHPNLVGGVGKFAAWAEVLKGLRLHGDETLLDLGCGRGAVLLAVAKLLPNGRAIGVDLWRADQTDNSPDNTLRNAALENVADRVEVHTADITDLPFDDNSVDVIVSSLVIHNISEAEGRAKALSEAARVLRPGGKLAIADLAATDQHLRQLRDLGWTTARRRNLGWRMWWGPGLATHLVTATKPAMPAAH
jgi:arsenite methyltransferase